MASPVYTDRPQAGNILSNSQVDLRNNFNYLDVALARDHNIAYADAAADVTQGYHVKVSYKAQGSVDPGLPTSADSFSYSFGGNQYWKNATTASGVQMTNTNVGSPVNATNGYTFLPGGLMIQWGQGTSSANINFPLAFSSAPFSVTANVLSAGNTLAVQINTVSSTQFSYNVFKNSGGTMAGIIFSWMAIGPK